MISCFSSGTKELPPRARRILSEPDDWYIIHGTTSACAENTSKNISRYRKCGNYLRVRGEYTATGYTVTIPWELPPRARRIHTLNFHRGREHGTTSACAENTRRWSRRGR